MKRFLLTYPKSGSDWIKYIAETLTGRPTTDANEKVSRMASVILRYDPDDATVNLEKPPVLIKFHHPKDGPHNGANLVDNGENVLLLSLRSFSEVIPSVLYSKYLYRVTKRKNSSLKSRVKSILIGSRPLSKGESLNVFLKKKSYENELANYASNIIFFDNWQGPKHLISYENLISTPKEEIEKLSEVLGVDEETFSQFMGKLEYHRQRALTNKTGPQPQFQRKSPKLANNTAGNSTNFFSSLLTDEQKQTIREKLDSQIPQNLQLKYLSSYLDLIKLDL